MPTPAEIEVAVDQMLVDMGLLNDIIHGGVSDTVVTDGGVVKSIANAIQTALGGLTGSATYDPANLADAAGVTTTVTVTGAVLGDYAMASFSQPLQGIILSAWVSATNTVSVRFQNETGGAINLASGTLRARVFTAG